VAATGQVHDAAELVAEISRTRAAFASAGIRSTRLYESVDQPNEVMVFHGMDDQRQAQSLAALPAPGMRWASRAGLRVYPALFVGTVMDAFDVTPSDGQH
jgi:hypothetical protein